MQSYIITYSIFLTLQFHGAIAKLDLYSIMESTKKRKDFEGIEITANYAEGIHFWFFGIVLSLKNR